MSEEKELLEYLKSKSIIAHKLENILDKTELQTLSWLKEFDITNNRTNLDSLKELIFFTNNYSKKDILNTGEIKLSNKLEKNEEIVDIVLATLFQWFGTSVGTYCLKKLSGKLKVK